MYLFATKGIREAWSVYLFPSAMSTLKCHARTTHSFLQSAVPLGTCRVRTSSRFRRLKSTVNKVSSLRDFSINKPYRYFTIDMTIDNPLLFRQYPHEQGFRVQIYNILFCFIRLFTKLRFVASVDAFPVSLRTQKLLLTH